MERLACPAWHNPYRHVGGHMRFGLFTATLLLTGCIQQEPPSPAPTTQEPTPVVEAPEPDQLEHAEALEEPVPGTVSAVSISDDSKEKLGVYIRRRNELYEYLWSVARTIDDNNHVGTMYNEIGIPEARCFAAGTLLGLDTTVRHLDVEEEPDLVSNTLENGHALRVIGLTHGNSSGVAKAILDLERDEIVLIWNLDCVGFHEIPKSAYIVQEGKSSFYEVRNEGQVLMVRGDIEPGYADKIIEALEANPSVKVVGLGSGGGLVKEALRAGLYIRQNGYDTVLWNNCYSACPLVFMAGNQRQIWSPYPYLGFHQIYGQDGVAISFDDPAYRAVAQYLVRMNIEPRYVLSKMWSAPPHDMTNVFGYEPELCDANITTWIQRGCSSRDYQPHRD